MAPTSKKEDDFEFIMTCLMHTDGLPKPDFDKVAAALGAKDAKSCYHKHWRILNEWGMTKKRGKQPKANNATAVDAANSEETPAPSATEHSEKKRKRASPKKPAEKVNVIADIEDDVEEVNVPVKKAKGKTNGDGPKIEVGYQD